ncbi:hypothetical protein Tco_1448827 [Tanacetum coccineum]
MVNHGIAIVAMSPCGGVGSVSLEAIGLGAYLAAEAHSILIQAKDIIQPVHLSGCALDGLGEAENKNRAVGDANQPQNEQENGAINGNNKWWGIVK